MIKAGLITTSHELIPFLKIVKKISSIACVAIYDPELTGGKYLGINDSTIIQDYHEFLSKLDAVLIWSSCQPNIFGLIEGALKASRHVYIADPLCFEVSEATRILKLHSEISSYLFLGNLSAIQNYQSQLAGANLRWMHIRKTMHSGEDMNYTLKHCISQSNHLIKSDLKKVDAFQLPIDDYQCEVGEVRMEFFNGTVMNVQLVPEIWNKEYVIEVIWNNNFVKFDFNNHKVYSHVQNNKQVNELKACALPQRVENELHEFEAIIASTRLHKGNNVENRLNPIFIYQYLSEKFKRTSIIC